MSDNPFFTTEEQPPAQPAGEPNAQPQVEMETPFVTHQDAMGGGFTGEADLPSEEAPKEPGQSEAPTPAFPVFSGPAVDPRLAGLGYPPQNRPATYGSYYPPQVAPTAPPQQVPTGAPPAQAQQASEQVEALEALKLTLAADQVENPQDVETLNTIVDHINKVLERVNLLDTRHGAFRQNYQEAQLNQAKDEEFREMTWFDSKLQALGEAFHGVLGQGGMDALMTGSPAMMARNKLWQDYNRLIDAYPAVPEEQVFNYAMQFAFPGHNGTQEDQGLRAKLKTRTAAGQPQPTRSKRQAGVPQFGVKAAEAWVAENYGDQLVPA